MKFKLENFRTKLDKCPICGCNSLYIDNASLTFDGYLHIGWLQCNNPDCYAKFEFHSGWLIRI